MKDEDVVSLWHIAERLDLVRILERAAGKKKQGYSVGLLTVLMAIQDSVAPGSRRMFHDWYSKTALPKLLDLPTEEIKYRNLLRSRDYWKHDPISKKGPIDKAEIRILDKLRSDLGIKPKGVIWYPISISSDSITNSHEQEGNYPDHSKLNMDFFLDMEHHFPLYSRSYEGDVTIGSRFRAAAEDLLELHPGWNPMIIGNYAAVDKVSLIAVRSLGYSSLFDLTEENPWHWKMLRNLEPDFDMEFHYKGDHLLTKRQGINLSGRDSCVYIFLNKRQAEQKARSREEAINSCEAELKALNIDDCRSPEGKRQIEKQIEAIPEKYGISQFLTTDLFQHRSGRWSLYINIKKPILKQLKTRIDGRSMVLASLVDMPPEKLYSIYRDSRRSIDSISTAMNEIERRPTFVSKEQSIRGHIFIWQMSLLLRFICNTFPKSPLS